MKLRLQFDRVINFAAALTLRHVIDETSPLFGLTPQELKLADSRMHASIVCVDPVLQTPVQVTRFDTPTETKNDPGHYLRSR
jgi:hypothetical protein